MQASLPIRLDRGDWVVSIQDQDRFAPLYLIKKTAQIILSFGYTGLFHMAIIAMSETVVSAFCYPNHRGCMERTRPMMAIVA